MLYRQLVQPYGHHPSQTPIILGMGETPEEVIARLQKEEAVTAAARGSAASIKAASAGDAEEALKQQRIEMERMKKEMKKEMLQMIARQLSFSIALNAIPVVGPLVSFITGAFTKKSAEHYKRKSERFVAEVKADIIKYRTSREALVMAALGRTYEAEYNGAENAAIALITKKVSAVHIEGMDGFSLRKAFRSVTKVISKSVSSLTKTIKDPTRLLTKPYEVAKDFADDITGKSGYDATVAAGNKQRTKAKAEIKELTDKQIAQAQSPHGHSLMQAEIMKTLLASPQFKHLAQLMLDTRYAKAKAIKDKAMMKKVAIGAGVVAAVVAVKVMMD